MKHQKHIQLIRKENDTLAPNEIVFLGTKCSIISELIVKISENLHSKYKIAYLDASHSETAVASTLDTFTFHHSGNLIIQKEAKFNPYNERLRYNSYEITFINGNHYEGNKQVIFLDEAKEKSITKRIDQINDIQFFIRKDKEAFVFDCIKNKFPNWKSIPCYDLSEIEDISAKINQMFQNETPILEAVVLAGGKSSRMGKDKSKLDYHGKEHAIFLADLLKESGLKTYVSLRNKKEIEFPIIVDRFLDLGPFGAICSAFLQNPNKAYLVLATDLPFIDQGFIDLIVKNRNPSKIATTVKGKSKKFPEPLITIWEPKSYPVLLQYLAQGISCPRKVLINSDVEIIEVEDKFITNVNTSQEFETVKSSLK